MGASTYSGTIMKDGLISVLLRGVLARYLKGFLLLICAFVASGAYAHGVSEGDQSFVESARGVNIIPYIYLGAKHMVTGYDHLLFLFGVIFFLYRLKDVGKYVTLFAVGHSVTLLAGVMLDIKANAFIIDAVIGLSVVYKALDNLGAFKTILGFEPNPKVAVLVFGLFHGFGLATKIQELSISKDGLFTNLVSFNIGVELGQLIALSLILLVMSLWRQTANFKRSATFANGLLMTAGLVLAGWQLSGYFYPGV